MCPRAYMESEGKDQRAHPGSLIGAFAARYHNHWILQNVCMESKGPGDNFAHAQDDLNLRILRMLESTFSLVAAHLKVI